MHNEALKFWTVVDVPDPYALLGLDDQQTGVIDGDAGGTWNPTYPVTIGDSGLVVTGPSSFSNAFGNTDGSCILSLQGTCTVQSGGLIDFKLGSILNLNASSHVEFQSGAIVTWANASYAASSALTLTTTLTGAVDWFNFTPTFASSSSVAFSTSSALSFLGGATWNQSAGTTWNGTIVYGTGAIITRHGPLVLSGSAATTTFRYGGATVDDDAHYDNSFDAYTVPSLSANRRYTIDTSNAYDGNLATFTCLVHGSMPTITFVRGDGTTIATSPTTGPWWLTIEYSASTSSWHTYAWASGDTNTQSQN